MHEHGVLVMLDMCHWVCARFVEYKRTVFQLGGSASCMLLESGEAAIWLRAIRADSRAVVVPSSRPPGLLSSALSLSD